MRGRHCCDSSIWRPIADRMADKETGSVGFIQIVGFSLMKECLQVGGPDNVGVLLVEEKTSRARVIARQVEQLFGVRPQCYRPVADETRKASLAPPFKCCHYDHRICG